MGGPTRTGAERAENKPKEEINPRCIVRFRPHDNWDGEYGFDWFRRGDTIEKYNTEEVRNPDGTKRTKKNYCDYSTLIGKYIPKVKYSGSQNRFARYAIYDPVSDEARDASHTIQNDCLDKFCREYEYRGIKGRNKNYFVPVLSLFYKNSEVRSEDWGLTTARVKILVESDSDYILSFIHDTDITIAFSNKRREGNYNVEDVTISCDFTSINTEKTTRIIEVRAKKNSNERGTLAGLLNIVFGKIKEIDICIAKVLISSQRVTDEHGRSIPACLINETHAACSAPTATQIEEEKKRIKKALAQAQILPNFMPDKKIYMEKNLYRHYFRRTTQENKPVMVIYPPSPSDPSSPSDLFNVLLHLFNSNIAERERAKYEKVYKVFFINESGGSYNWITRNTEGGLCGQANDIGSKETIVFKNDDSATVPHELLHCLGLKHSFENGNESNRNNRDNKDIHTFKKEETSNIMDYSYGGNSLWQCQWTELRKADGLEDYSVMNYTITP